LNGGPEMRAWVHYCMTQRSQKGGRKERRWDV
jgi:hypothetical protein